MDIQKVDAWRTPDGEVFTDEKEAIRHQKAVTLEEKLNAIVEDAYYYNCGPEEIVRGLLEQKDELIEALEEAK